MDVSGHAQRNKDTTREGRNAYIAILYFHQFVSSQFSLPQKLSGNARPRLYISFGIIPRVNGDGDGRCKKKKKKKT